MTFTTPRAAAAVALALVLPALAPISANAGGLAGLFSDFTSAVEQEIRNEIRDAASGSGGGAQGTATATPYRTDAQPRAATLEHPHPDAHHLTWDTKFTATGLADRKLIGHHFRFYCPPAPQRLTPRALFGTDRYAFHSVVCRVAVHAGEITLSGGNVTVRMEDGNMRLTGSTRNGMTTKTGSSGIRTLVFVR